ncbi:hypothetical protein [Arthrobacter sp. ES1]|uniref:hypothetical protein n=1 Tax=Arthrobacter sp. ES1 TaxID=1897056 RepID=UPI001CFFD61B|nr:hypothetical protein [Arthrobacter sp. ES1]MCB5280564.1 hypothetical protein [Arthrobacter sp. ES1]
MSADVKPFPDFTPTESLIIDVLVARYRLGDTLWTFKSRNMPALRKLEAKDLVHTTSGVTENTVRAWLSNKALRQHGTSWFQPGITRDHLPESGSPGHAPGAWSQAQVAQLIELAELPEAPDPRAINTAHILMIQMINSRHTAYHVLAGADGGVVLKGGDDPGDPTAKTVGISPDGESFQLHRDKGIETTLYFNDALFFTSGGSK